MGVTYRDSGVDIDAANEAVGRIKGHVRSTFGPEVLADIGGFGGLFAFDKSKYEDPVLVASTDGVGTKLKIAFALDRHDTVGIDLVSHCINDILVQGARPLFFLDYISVGRLKPHVIEEIVKGLAAGCREGGCALIGGETAEMPGLYADGEYDLAGTIVGVVERGSLILGKSIKPGDMILGLPSTGLHTNGYSLARKICFDLAGLSPTDYVSELGTSIGEELLKPHRCYEKALRPFIRKGIIKGMAHITGGGFYDNIPRILPEGCRAHIMKGSWPVLPIFEYLASKGNVPENDMYRTFNMGIGMVVVIDRDDARDMVSALEKMGEPAYVIGEIRAGEKRVVIE